MSVLSKKRVGRRIQAVLAMAIAIAPLLFGQLATAAGSATLSLSPASGNIANGSSLTIGIYENSGSTAINAVQANLNYPAASLSFVSITSSSSFPITGGDNSGAGGSVKISRATSSSLTGSHLVASVRFKALTSSG